MNDTINLTIDGSDVTVPKEATILEAAKAVGIHIPTLCYHAKLLPIASCRVCLVEVEGTEKPVTACNTAVTDGMKVCTTSERLFALRQEAIRFMLVSHPLDCPICDKGGECRLQDLAFEFEVNEDRYSVSPPAVPIDTLSPLVERNNNRCVRCGRCVSICNEIQGERALEWVNRGFETEILPRGGYPLDCEFCGQCISVCPVGALTNRLFKYKSRVWDMEKVPSVCPYCGGGCAIELNVRDNKVLRVTSDDEETHNEGNLCGRGNFGFGFIHNNDRLHTPLVKRRNDQTPVSWDEALSAATEDLKKILSASGPDSIAGLGSPRISNEDNFLLQKFFRTCIGTNNIDSPAHFNARNLERGLKPTLGFPAGPDGFGDLEAPEVMVVIGSDVRAEMPPAATQIMKAARFRGSTLFVANPVVTKLDRYANLSLRYRPGTEQILVAGLLKVIIENGWENKAFIDEHVAHYSDLQASLNDLSLAKVTQGTGVPEDKIAVVAESFARKQTGVLVFGHYVFTHDRGAEVVGSLANLALLTGKIGRKDSGLIPVIAKNNGQGMLDMGVTPDQLPGYQSVEDSAPFEKAWGKAIPRQPGKNAEGLLEAIEQNTVKALYLVGCNPLTDFPEPERWKKALEKLEWLAVQDVFSTEAAAVAHYVFPAVTFAEKAGTFTSGERRVQKFDPAIDRYRNALPDWEIIQKLAQQMGYPLRYTHPSQIMKEISTLVPHYGGISYEKLTRQGIQWPLGDSGDSPHVTLDKLRCAFVPVASPEPEAPKSGKLFLVTGSAFFHSGTLSTYAQGLNVLGENAWVEIHERDADRLGLSEGDTAKISMSEHSMNVPLKVTAAVPPGTAFVPHHFRNARVNAFIARGNCCQVDIVKG